MAYKLITESRKSVLPALPSKINILVIKPSSIYSALSASITPPYASRKKMLQREEPYFILRTPNINSKSLLVIIEYFLRSKNITKLMLTT